MLIKLKQEQSRRMGEWQESFGPMGNQSMPLFILPHGLLMLPNTLILFCLLGRAAGLMLLVHELSGREPR